MSSVSERTARHQRIMTPLLVGAVLFGLAGLPLAVWLDLRGLSERMLETQAVETGRVIDQMRSFYASDVVQAVNGATGRVVTTHDYKGVPNAIPIPAMLSLELGERISGEHGAVRYRFISDLPFKDRKPHDLDGFETRALADLRAHPDSRFAREATGSIFDRQIRIAAPIRMESACVRCHNAHPRARRPTGRSATCAASRRSRCARRSSPTSSPSSTCWAISSCASPGRLSCCCRPAIPTDRPINRELRSNGSWQRLGSDREVYLAPGL